MELLAFTVEEENLICIFDMSSREALINDINEAMPYFEDNELREIACAAISKLERMTDAEFYGSIFSPDYMTTDDETEV